jgi:hypothetical protein
MSPFVKQRVHCPACGASHVADIQVSGRMLAVSGLCLCCGDDCRKALRQARARYVMGVAQIGNDPLEHLLLLLRRLAVESDS